METTWAAAVSGSSSGTNFREVARGSADSARRMTVKSRVLCGSQFLSQIRPALNEFTSLLPAPFKLLRRTTRVLDEEPLLDLVFLLFRKDLAHYLRQNQRR